MYQQYTFNFKTREKDPTLMNAFQKRNFKLLVDPIEQNFLFRTRRKQAKRSMRLKAYYFRKAGPSHYHQTVYFGQCIFSRSTENDPFVQSITNDDVLANNRRRDHYFFRKQFTSHLRPSAGSSELQSITFQQQSDRLSKLQRPTQVL